MTVRLDGEVVYDDTHLLAAEGDDSATNLTDELPDERGEITVETGIDDRGIMESESFDDDRCYEVIVEHSGENLIYWQSGSGEGCEAFREE